jgi:hypothetical protein
MPKAHSRIISKAAKTELAPLGFKQQGQSRLWIADHGSWLNIVGFVPSRWSVTVDLDNAVHWLWAGTGFMSLNYVCPRLAHAEFENEDQFADALTGISKTAAARAREIEGKFSSFDAVAAHVIKEATGDDRMGPSWFGYYAGIASGLIGNFDQAEVFLCGITDERVRPHADVLLEAITDPSRFRAIVNERVSRQREVLKLPELNRSPF